MKKKMSSHFNPEGMNVILRAINGLCSDAESLREADYFVEDVLAKEGHNRTFIPFCR
jgi:hypothetical protein